MAHNRRLVDYFVVAGYDYSSRGRRPDRGDLTCQGVVIQRFPKIDWPDTPFAGKIQTLKKILISKLWKS
jgi:hypothetical protein